MAVRDIISIDQELCDGCGDCVSSCVEGAIQLVDGKAKLVSDTYCDGLGACLSHCPRGAITITRRESAEYDEKAVATHLESLRPRSRAIPTPIQLDAAQAHGHGGCPGSRSMSFARPEARSAPAAEEPSQLRHWPIQLHLVSPTAPFFQGADVLLAADCVAFAVGGFHSRFLAGTSLAIACPKLDSRQEAYVDKLAAMVDQAGIASLTVTIMEVPCCGGLVRLVQEALARCQRAVPVTVRVVGVRGDILGERVLAPQAGAVAR